MYDMQQLFVTSKESRCKMKEFIEKLIGRLEEYEQSHLIAHDSELCKHCQGMDCLETLADCTICVMNKAIEIVQELEKEYKGGWIPCSERLPERDMWCLATFESGGIDKIQYLFLQRWWDGEMGGNRVVAWQPLPAPYKEGDQRWENLRLSEIVRYAVESLSQHTAEHFVVAINAQA